MFGRWGLGTSSQTWENPGSADPGWRGLTLDEENSKRYLLSSGNQVSSLSDNRSDKFIFIQKL
jgi:hypothetical protein